MQHAQTIAIARGLLAEGRAPDVERMLAPLVAPLPDGRVPAHSDAPDALTVRVLLARTRLVRRGDARGVQALLGPYAAAAVREGLPPEARAEVALWMGWSHAWLDAATYDDARALNYLDEADRLFRESMNAEGRCWTHLGRALVFFSMDEHLLLQRALEQAEAIQDKLRDRQAAPLLSELSALAARRRGHYALAEHHLQALWSRAEALGDEAACGRARALEALVGLDRGAAPEVVLACVDEAEAALARTGAHAGHSGLAAFRAACGALLRVGDWPACAARIAEGEARLAGIASGPCHVHLEKTRLALRRGDLAAGRQALDRVQTLLHRHPRRLVTNDAWLLQSALAAAQGATDEARRWAERSRRHAHETHDGRQELEALLVLAALAVRDGDAQQARALLDRTEQLGAFLSLLPLTGRRDALLGAIAEASGEEDEARVFFTQAMAASSMAGDALQTADVQLALARLARARTPSRCRPLLLAALKTFERLGRTAEKEEARTLLRAIDARGAQPPADQEAPPAQVGALLARASVSVELVAEAWLQVAAEPLADRWLAVFCRAETGYWREVRAHGTPPAHVAFPGPELSEGRVGRVVWLRLRAHPGPAYFFGVAVEHGQDTPLRRALRALRPWVAVAGLAFDHALLRARRIDPDAREAPSGAGTENALRAFVFASPAMQELVQQIERMRASLCPVLLVGEPGTGKTRVGRVVHEMSERAARPFVVFDASALPPDLVEGALAGYAPAASEGDGSPRGQGAVREADGGTLYLDEVADLTDEAQMQLLRLLEENEVWPVGASSPVAANVRIVAATARPLDQLVRQGLFREELYYRLNVLPLPVPPLRERREEIPLLARHFVSSLALHHTALTTITGRAMDALLRYDWPGNVRQLRNEVERAMTLVGSEPAPTIDLKDLSPALRSDDAAGRTAAAGTPRAPLNGLDVDAVLVETERSLVERVLSEQAGRISAAAEVLGLTRQGLYKKLKRLGIDPATAGAATPRRPGGAPPHTTVTRNHPAP